MLSPCNLGTGFHVVMGERKMKKIMSEVIELKKKPIIKPETTSEERTWAAIAHFSTLLTVLVGFGTAGLGGIFFVFVPLIIYFMYKDKSSYVADQAAQAFAVQLAGTVGYFLLILIGIIVMLLVWLITIILSMILVGLILIPVALIITVIIILLWIAYPPALMVVSLVAGIQTLNGADYEVPYIGEHVRDWLAQYEADQVEQAPLV